MIELYVWIISHKHGENYYFAFDEHLVIRQVYDDYITEYWDDVLPYEPLPNDPAEAIERYFDPEQNNETYSTDIWVFPVDDLRQVLACYDTAHNPSSPSIL